MNKLVFVCSLFLAINISACSYKVYSNELSEQNAISIAIKVAKVNGFDCSKSSIELLKVADGHERGPMRLSTLGSYLSDEQNFVRMKDSKYWIIYFYPNNFMENPTFFGPEFYVLIDLHSGEVIDSFRGH